jgi:very-short-patch-repair endonuclease
MREESANSDRLIANLAGRQHGVVSSAQLGNAGIDKDGISRRLKSGHLHHLHRAVYAVGHTKLSFEGRCMAAVLALGDAAVVSHQSAAALWGMLKPANGAIHVTLPGDGGRRRRRGIRIHRSPTFTADFRTLRNGIAVTTPARTLKDLHRTVKEEVYERAVRRALDLRWITSDDLKAEEEFTRSKLERLMFRFCRQHRLPQPEVNARVDRFEVDFLWRDQKVIVETDSWRHHGDRAAFERDRARDAHLQSLGFRVLRFTWRQIRETPVFVARTLRALLAQPQLAPYSRYSR